jgi:hypothetical protein
LEFLSVDSAVSFSDEKYSFKYFIIFSSLLSEEKFSEKVCLPNCLLSLILGGARISAAIGVLVVVLSTLPEVAVGFFAGYRGKAVDVMSRPPVFPACPTSASSCRPTSAA